MTYNPENIFAKILRGDAPCVKVHETEQVLCFMDLMPQSDGHMLVVPKEPAETIFELSPAAAAAAIVVVQRLAVAVKKAMGAEGIQLVQANGSAAGQTVPHIHFHIIPRWTRQELKGHGAAQGDAETLKSNARKIIAALKDAQV